MHTPVSPGSGPSVSHEKRQGVMQQQCALHTVEQNVSRQAYSHLLEAHSEQHALKLSLWGHIPQRQMPGAR